MDKSVPGHAAQNAAPFAPDRKSNPAIDTRVQTGTFPGGAAAILEKDGGTVCGLSHRYAGGVS